MRSLSVSMFALVAVVLAALAIQGADAHYIRFYYGNSDCAGAYSSLWLLGYSTSCVNNWNSTFTNQGGASFQLSKCNATSGQYTFDSYSANSCTGINTKKIDNPAADTSDSIGEGSMRVVCSAGS